VSLPEPRPDSTTPRRPAAGRVVRTVALLNWCHLIEDFVDHLGVSIDEYATSFMGSWVFGYAQALRSAGVRPVLYCVSARISSVTRQTHRPTGTSVCVLPAPSAYRRVRSRIPNPYAASFEDAVGEVRGARRAVLSVLKEAAPYLSTPLFRLARELRRDACDAIVCQEYENARFDECVALGRLMGLPVFATFQGGDTPPTSWQRAVRSAAVRGAAGLIVAASRERDRVRAEYGVPAGKIAGLFNPLDLGTWHAEDRSRARSALGLPEAVRIVVWHGRVLLERKGLDVLVDAWERLQATRPGRGDRLVLIGTGEDADRLRTRLAADGPGGVLWVDRFLTDRAEIRRHLSAADVYVLPSRQEGFPVALVEAMACGLPVVASATHGVMDLLADEPGAGILVPPGDAPALAAALERLLGDAHARRAMGREARELVLATVEVDSVGSRLRDFLEQSR